MPFTAADAKRAYARHFMAPALQRIARGSPMTPKQRRAYLRAKEEALNASIPVIWQEMRADFDRQAAEALAACPPYRASSRPTYADTTERPQ